MLLCGIATVDEEVEAGDELVLHEEHDAVRDLLGGAETAKRMQRDEILEAIRDFIEYKRQQDKKNPMWKDVSDEDVCMAAESPLENDLFADFFKVLCFGMRNRNGCIFSQHQH